MTLMHGATAFSIVTFGTQVCTELDKIIRRCDTLRHHDITIDIRYHHRPIIIKLVKDQGFHYGR